ncbi:MFS transporter [Aspergillus mulundensis]|uniref:Major facilitator superfamily (MFS) profile domain-containing protein n=1 Tax=Aspergillus mulundensis TaxID=1810919 RepID=A0A3D8QVA5_9EURO|nr:Uncharacterized protein DSM5745_09438 [Aspergillus mulundensis]RDW65699.1 Uncharacterized protein DSM5745_09438 [Aspergillus mulundensis]
MPKDITFLDLSFDSELPIPVRPNKDIAQPNLSKLGSPYQWSSFQKSFITWLSCITTLFASFATSCYSPGAEQMSSEWEVSRVAALLGITTFCCGMGFAPMFLVPLSEIVGRKPVFVGTAVMLVLFQVCCAVTRLYSGMLVARFFAGVGGSTFTTMVGGIVADMYKSRERNAPMALFTGSALFGTGLGPLVCGFVAQYTTWRWIFYMQILIDGIIALALLLFFRETRGVVILGKRANTLNRYYERLEEHGCPGVQLPSNQVNNNSPEQEKANIHRIRFKVAEHEERAHLSTTLRISISRPFILLVSEPVVFFFSLWSAFSWSVLYINLSAIPLVYQSTYAFSLAHSNAIFTATCAASLLSTLLSITQSKLASRHWRNWNTCPEHRLYFACVESVLLPIGLFMFGWTAQPDFRIHWIVPTVAVGLSTMGIFSIYLAVFNYLADTYGGYASSALAAQNFCRNLMNGVFPLVSRQLFKNLGFGPAASLLGGVAAGLTLVPWLLVLFGRRIRGRSRLAGGV